MKWSFLTSNVRWVLEILNRRQAEATTRIEASMTR